MESGVNCPSCKSGNIKQGSVIGQGDGPCQASLFRPVVGARVVTSEGLAIHSTFHVCVECGLLWQNLPNVSKARLATYERDATLF